MRSLSEGRQKNFLVGQENLWPAQLKHPELIFRCIIQEFVWCAKINTRRALTCSELLHMKQGGQISGWCNNERINVHLCKPGIFVWPTKIFLQLERKVSLLIPKQGFRSIQLNGLLRVLWTREVVAVQAYTKTRNLFVRTRRRNILRIVSRTLIRARACICVYARSPWPITRRRQFYLQNVCCRDTHRDV